LIFKGFSRQAKVARSGQIRRNFIIECVENLKFNLIKRFKSDLVILYGEPVTEIIKLIDRINEIVQVKFLIAEKEIATEEISLENRLKTRLYERKINFSLIWLVNFFRYRFFLFFKGKIFRSRFY
jgi:deoxyribodipyrimidine photolyase